LFVDEGEAKLRAEDIDGSSHAVGVDAVWRDDRGGDIGGEAEAGFWIEDV